MDISARSTVKYVDGIYQCRLPSPRFLVDDTTVLPALGADEKSVMNSLIRFKELSRFGVSMSLGVGFDDGCEPMARGRGRSGWS